MYAGPDSPGRKVWLGFVLKFYTPLLYSKRTKHLLLPDPVRKATSSLSSLTYIVTRVAPGYTDQQRIILQSLLLSIGLLALEGRHCKLISWSLEIPSQDWLFLGFHRLELELGGKSGRVRWCLTSIDLLVWDTLWGRRWYQLLLAGQVRPSSDLYSEESQVTRHNAILIPVITMTNTTVCNGSPFI